jgi:vacuolar iron transporter family protein
LAGTWQNEHYASERAREVAETGANPAAEVSHILRAFGLTAEESVPIVAALRRRPEAWSISRCASSLASKSRIPAGR